MLAFTPDSVHNTYNVHVYACVDYQNLFSLLSLTFSMKDLWSFSYLVGVGVFSQVSMLEQKMLCPCLLCAASVFSLHCLPYLTLLETMILRLVNWCVILALFYVWNEMDQNTKLSLDHYYFNALIRFSKQLPAQLWQWISMFWFCHIRTRNTFLVFDVF